MSGCASNAKLTQSIKAIRAAQWWCRANEIETPRFRRDERVRGLYDWRKREIIYGLRLATLDTPGELKDMSIAGTIAHELGHHWQHCAGLRSVWREARRVLRSGGVRYVWIKGGKIHVDETVAEWFRVWWLKGQRFEIFADLTPLTSRLRRDILS